MITRSETIDHQNPTSEKIFKRVVDQFRNDCLRSVVSEKSIREGGRVLRREIQRRKLDENTTEDGNKLTIEATSKNRPIGRLTVTLLNTPLEEPELTEEEQ